MLKRLNISLHVFALLAILLIPAANKLFTFQDEVATFLFGDLVEALGYNHHQFSSDTFALNILLLLLLLLSFVIGFSIAGWSKWQKHSAKIIALIRLIMIYYLASRLLIYGFDKLFKTQFYQPEPNTLYTPFGQMSKDILFWSTMGTSRAYSIITGLLEILPALLLLHKKTRTAGLLITIFVMVNVMAINFGFDISVKLYSLFLTFLAVLLLWPSLAPLFQFFAGKQAQLKEEGKTFEFFYKPFIKGSLKSMFIGLMLLEATFFALTTGNFNDDTADRPAFHGAYEYDVLGAMDRYNEVKRFFIHRRGFIIFETYEGDFIDYKLEIDHSRNRFVCTDYTGEVNEMAYKLYNEGERMDVEMSLIGWNYSVWMTFQKLDHESLPALQDEFHWTIDSFLEEN